MAREIESKDKDKLSNLADIGGGYEAASAQATSDAKLEDDHGEGQPVILRMFEFSANPEAFKIHSPTKQELFNSHAKGIEVMLWKDGMKLFTEVDPKVTINKKKTKYRIFVAAIPQRGHLLMERPKTLSQIANNL